MEELNDISRFETDKFKLLRRLYAYYGFDLTLHGTRKRDKFWLEAEFVNGPKDAFDWFRSLTTFSVKYASVDRMCDYELLGHKTHPNAKEWLKRTEQADAEYFGCQTSFDDKLQGDIDWHWKVWTYVPNDLDKEYIKLYGEDAVDECRQCKRAHEPGMHEAYVNMPKVEKFRSWEELEEFLKKVGA